MKCSAAVTFLRVDVGASLNQRADRFGIPGFYGVNERWPGGRSHQQNGKTKRNDAT